MNIMMKWNLIPTLPWIWWEELAKEARALGRFFVVDASHEPCLCPIGESRQEALHEEGL